MDPEYLKTIFDAVKEALESRTPAPRSLRPRRIKKFFQKKSPPTFKPGEIAVDITGEPCLVIRCAGKVNPKDQDSDVWWVVKYPGKEEPMKILQSDLVTNFTKKLERLRGQDKKV
jgi:hypothetical protein